MVHKARGAILGRNVAVKVLPPDKAGSASNRLGIVAVQSPLPSLLSWLILYNGFFAAAHLVQNDVGGGLPDEGFGLFVPACEPPVYGAFQFVD